MTVSITRRSLGNKFVRNRTRLQGVKTTSHYDILEGKKLVFIVPLFVVASLLLLELSSKINYSENFI